MISHTSVKSVYSFFGEQKTFQIYPAVTENYIPGPFFDLKTLSCSLFVTFIVLTKHRSWTAVIELRFNH